MIKIVLFSLSLFLLNGYSRGQEIGDIQEVKLILQDIPYSGDAIQPNFMSLDSSEVISFTHMDWLDKHVTLLDFFHTYRYTCLEGNFIFKATMIYIPMEQYNHVRYEGYIPTGEIANQWVLTSIVKEEDDE